MSNLMFYSVPVYDSTEESVEFSNWAPGEPDGFYRSILVNPKTSQWIDLFYSGNDNYHVICEAPERKL